MIIEYHRPEDINQALKLLSRNTPDTRVLAGGTMISTLPEPDIAVVDIQDLLLDRIEIKNNKLEIGAAVRLQRLVEFLEQDSEIENQFCRVLIDVIKKENSFNMREAASIVGTVISCDGRSPLATLLLAADAGFMVHSIDEASGMETQVGEVLPLRSHELKGKLVSSILIPLSIKLAYHSVSRSPVDLPIVCAAAARWPSGRTRLVLGGYGDAPLMVLDGVGGDGLEESATDVYSAAEDAWASAEYRKETAAVLASRCLADVQNES